MIEEWERRSEEWWVDRWIRLFGRKPKNPEKIKRKRVNGSTTADSRFRTLRDDAMTPASQKFKQRIQ